jgi:hypothetical protein
LFWKFWVLFKVVCARRMGRGGDVAQRRLLSIPVYVTRKYNETLYFELK